MIIGVPKEIKPAERRVGMPPSSIRELIAHGHDVIVETTAGLGVAATDDDWPDGLGDEPDLMELTAAVNEGELEFLPPEAANGAHAHLLNFSWRKKSYS